MISRSVNRVRSVNCTALPYRSARSLQKCENFLWRFLQECVFLQLLRNEYTAFLDFFNYFIEYFSWHRVSQLKLSITQNSWEANFVPIMVILVTGENAVLVKHSKSISLELSSSGCWTLRGLFAILTSFWQIKFDMYQPSGLVDVLVKCCCCNIPAT